MDWWIFFHLKCLRFIWFAGFVSWGVLRDLKHAPYDTRACDQSRFYEQFVFRSANLKEL